MLINHGMNDGIDEKVVDIFKKHNSPANETRDKSMRYFAGYNYVKLSNLSAFL